MSRAKTICILNRILFEFSYLKERKRRLSQQADGLRNSPVHEYDAIVDALVLDAIRKAQMIFPKYVAAIEA